MGTFTQREISPPPGKFAVKVKNTLDAFKKLAAYRRSNFSGTVIGVTGSVGKSTTKELLAHLLSPFFRVYKNQKSFNNEIGVAYTLSNLPSQSNLLVQEIGTNSPGEVALLRDLVDPHISLVTAVEIAHAQGFGSLEAILKEKLSITHKREFAVVPFHLSRFSMAKETITFGREGEVKLTSLSLSPHGTTFTVRAFSRELKFNTPVPGYSVVNATLLAVAVAKILDIPLAELPPLVSSFTPPSGRLRVERYGSTVLIDDSYNANPSSFKNAVKVLSLFEGERVAVVGQMLELGSYSKEEHRKLASLLEEAEVSLLVAYGEEALHTLNAFKGKKFYFSDRNSLLDFFRELPLKGKVILVKGSRGNRLEEVCQIIRERLKS